ncbi:MAG: fumarylacetoacetase [Acidobacteriaceae bacterium]
MAATSWVTSANDSASDFPLQNLPYGIFRHGETTRVGIAIGDRILDLDACASHGLLIGLPDTTLTACSADLLNPLMALGPAAWSALRRRLTSMLDASQCDPKTRDQIEPHLIAMRAVEMQLPASIGDYTDFYASIHHATRVGKLFRPEAPLLPNYKYVPIGYHGRASSIVVSGADIVRPHGQTKSTEGEPVFGPTQALDYELEIGLFVGPGNTLGQPIPISAAEQHIFGLCLLNDWSARDIQRWEYQPLGPFLAKSFATTISPWIVPLEALAPYRVAAPSRPPRDPAPLAYLASPPDLLHAFDITLEVYLESRTMRDSHTAPMLLSRGNLRDLYWTLPQLIAHHTSNGCNLRPGDLLATGTLSGADEGSEGCLLEKQLSATSLQLPGGERRTALEDGDRVTFRAHSEKAGRPRIGLGECSGTVSGSPQTSR